MAFGRVFPSACWAQKRCLSCFNLITNRRVPSNVLFRLPFVLEVKPPSLLFQISFSLDWHTWGAHWYSLEVGIRSYSWISLLSIYNDIYIYVLKCPLTIFGFGFSWDFPTIIIISCILIDNIWMSDSQEDGSTTWPSLRHNAQSTYHTISLCEHITIGLCTR